LIWWWRRGGIVEVASLGGCFGSASACCDAFGYALFIMLIEVVHARLAVSVHAHCSHSLPLMTIVTTAHCTRALPLATITTTAHSSHSLPLVTIVTTADCSRSLPFAPIVIVAHYSRCLPLMTIMTTAHCLHSLPFATIVTVAHCSHRLPRGHPHSSRFVVTMAVAIPLTAMPWLEKPIKPGTLTGGDFSCNVLGFQKG
jgi:hypothetical protein